MKGKSGTEWTLRDSGADTIDLMCLAADIMDRERERTGLSPPETWAAISGDDHASVKARTEFIRRYLPEIAPALYTPETPTDKLPHKDLGFGDLGGGLAVFFVLLRASSGAPSPTSAEATRQDQTATE